MNSAFAPDRKVVPFNSAIEKPRCCARILPGAAYDPINEQSTGYVALPARKCDAKPFNPAPRSPMRASARQYLLHRAADRGRRLGDRDPGASERLHFVGGGAL